MGAAQSQLEAPRRPCLFCAIARGKSADNKLWYQDDDIAVFVPRTPEAALHMLVVPTKHVGTINELNTSHIALLQRMRRVAIATLRAHEDAVAAGTLRLKGRDVPPPHARIEIIDSVTGIDDALNENWRLAFHAPPFNSIGHLHLHALRLPFAGIGSAISFRDGTCWCVSHAQALQLATARSPRAKL